MVGASLPVPESDSKVGRGSSLELPLPFISCKYRHFFEWSKLFACFFAGGVSVEGIWQPYNLGDFVGQSRRDCRTKSPRLSCRRMSFTFLGLTAGLVVGRFDP